MVAPLLARGELVGVISTQSYEPCAFDADHRRLFSSIASQVAIAVENARLFGEVNRRLKEMRLLQKLILAASATLDFDEVLTRTIETLKETLQIERLAFALPNDDGSRLMVHPSTVGFPEGTEGPWTLPMDETTMGRAYRTGEALLFTDVTDVSSSLRGAPVTRTELAVPVWDGDEVVAVLNAESRVLEAFDEDDLSLFSAAAAQLGVVLKNARLFEQTRRRLTETRLLQQVMQAGAASLDFDQVLERTVETLHRTLGIEHLSFALPVEEETALRLHRSQIGYTPEMTEVNIPLEGSLAGRAYLTGEAQLIGDVRWRPDYFEGAPEVLSELNVPVRVAGRVVAVLNVESQRTNAFDEEDARLFEAVAAQLGVVLENARLYERLQQQRDELSQAYEELKEIDRLRTELVQNVSHELRTPFTLIQGYLELLMAGDLGPLSEEQREALLIVRSRVGALQRRTRDLTTLSSLSRQEAQSKPTCILEALRKAVADLTARAEKAGVRLAKELPETLSPVMANEDHLVQAFAHLIENAIKFSPDGGTVTIRAWSEGDQSFVAVDDEGIGIGPKHLNHVFKRFYQVDGSINRRFGGMGVGLAVVWEIVEMYGGSVDVRSSPEEGSTFTVALPQARSENVRQIPSVA
jgi:signal transduction histidine kinase